MNNDSIKKKIDGLYADAKSKGFLNHLIKAYIPIDKLIPVHEKPKEGKLICVLTNQKLISTSEISVSLQKSSLVFDPDFSIGEQISQKDIDDARKGKPHAFTGENTTTFISTEAAEALQEWVSERILNGDSHINWLINSMRNAANPNPFYKKKTSAEANGYRKPATTFGDLDSLQKLKLQFEAEEGK